jgi:phosphoglycolate phosphatase
VPSRILLLDLDRTLVDLQTHTDYARALIDASGLAGEVEQRSVPDTDWDRPTQACMSLLNSLAGSPQWSTVSAAVARHERAAIPMATAMPTVLDTLPILREHRTAVVTLLPADVSIEVLTACGIDVGPGAAIDLVVGRDPSMRPKPHADGLHAACLLLGRPISEAVMIGDSTWDRDAAAAAGAGFIGVPLTAGLLGPGVAEAATFAEAVSRALGP